MRNSNNLLKAIEILQTVGALDMTIVPIEPSINMMKAVKNLGIDIDDRDIKEIYAAMLLASDESRFI